MKLNSKWEAYLELLDENNEEENLLKIRIEKLLKKYENRDHSIPYDFAMYRFAYPRDRL